MSAIDACEAPIIRALQKSLWQIVSKPFIIRTDSRTVFADLLLQRRVNGNSEQMIVLEVKCFTESKNDLQEFYTAIGQYTFYREALALNQLAVPLYLAMPHPAYERLTSDSAIRAVLSQSMMKIVSVDLI